MNVFARELGLPLDWRAAWKTITRGEERRVNIGWANDRPFAQLAGVGFDAAALARVRPAWKRRLGPAAYFCAGVEALFAPMPRIRVSAEGEPPREGVWVVVGTGRYYGGPFPVFPGAQNGRGLLNVMVVRDLGLGCLLGGLCTLPVGWHAHIPQVSCFQTRSLRVESVAPLKTERPGLEVDGELSGHVPVDFRIEHAALRVATPSTARAGIR
jgi:diacylglycerol kinase family enzyme